MKITIEKAKELLSCNQVVAIPTETVYGLASSSQDPQAVHKIFSLKGRPSHNPLILHIGHHDDCLKFAKHIPHGLEALISAFWPGPLTVVIPINESLILPVVRANLATAAFRMPNHPLTIELLQAVSPLVAPSANLSGSPSATKPEHVENDFGSDFPVLDGGACLHGVESTIVIHVADRWQIARPGALSQENLAQVLGYLPNLVSLHGASPICPGQLLAHYAPKARLHLSRYTPNQVVVGFSDREYAGATKVIHLGSSQDPEMVAHMLYHVLRQLDVENIQDAWVDMDFPTAGLWKTIQERLSRAANQ